MNSVHTVAGLVVEVVVVVYVVTVVVVVEVVAVLEVKEGRGCKDFSHYHDDDHFDDFFFVQCLVKTVVTLSLDGSLMA